MIGECHEEMGFYTATTAWMRMQKLSVGFGRITNAEKVHVLNNTARHLGAAKIRYYVLLRTKGISRHADLWSFGLALVF